MPLWVKSYHEQGRLAEIEIKPQVTPVEETVKVVKKKGKEAEK